MNFNDVPVSNPPDSYLDVITPLIGTARSILEKGESLAAITFVGNFATKDVQPVLMDSRSAQSKDATATAIRSIAHAIKADFVFMIVEAWSLRPDKIKKADEILDKYGSIGASPYAIDIVSFTLETRYGTWVAQCPIKPLGHSKMKKTIATPAFRLFKEVQGRFTDLLPEKEGGLPDETSTLH